MKSIAFESNFCLAESYWRVNSRPQLFYRMICCFFRLIYDFDKKFKFEIFLFICVKICNLMDFFNLNDIIQSFNS